MTDVKRLGVVGAGQMGRGIAQVAARTGCEVVLLDATRELADAGKERIARDLGRLVDKGKLAAQDKEATLERIHPAGELRRPARGGPGRSRPRPRRRRSSWRSSGSWTGP